MEDSIKEFITHKCSHLNVHLNSLLSVNEKIKSPIEQIFFLEWQFQHMFLQNRKYFFFPQFKQAGITGNYIVDFMVLDRTYRPLIAIEIDGHDFHEKTKEQVRKDKKRERFISKNVTYFLRFSGSEVFRNPERSVNEVIELIEKAEEEKK